MSSIGPALPPGFRRPRHSDDEGGEDGRGEDGHSDGSDSAESAGREEHSRAQPQNIGPALPPGFSRQRRSGSASSDHSSASAASKEQDSRPARVGVIGPALPPHLSRDRAAEAPAASRRPPRRGQDEDSDDDEDDIVGPAAVSAEALREASYQDEDLVLAEIEERARRQKEALTQPQGRRDDTRDTWMTELPEKYKKDFGIGKNRGFRQTYASTGDASGWTETPEDRARKLEQRQAQASSEAAEEAAKQRKFAAAREKEAKIRQQVEEYNQERRGAALMEQHQRKRRSEFEAEQASKKDSATTVLKPFDPSKDLVQKRVSTTQRQDLLKRAAGLGSRFTSGSYS